MKSADYSIRDSEALICRYDSALCIPLCSQGRGTKERQIYQDNLYLVDALKSTPLVLAKLLDDCSSELAAKAPPTGWSIVQVVCHMRDNEERALERMRLMRDSSDPYVESYDQEQWAAERGYASVDFRQALIAYERFRIAHSCELAALSAGEWDRTGRHAERGITSIRIQTMRLLCHDSVHAAQIARLLDELARQ